MTLALRGDEGTTALLSLLADPTAGNEARRWAAIALGQSHSPRALLPLTAALQDEAELYLPFAAAIALGELELPGAVPALVAALADSRGLFGNTAMQALESIGRESILALVEALASGTPQQRRWVVRVLGKVGDTDDLDLLGLLSTMLRDGDPTVRWEAVDALAQLMGAGALEEVLPLLADPAPDVRDAVITLIGLHGGLPNIPALEHIRDLDAATNWEGDSLGENAEWAIEHIQERAQAQH